MLKISYAGCTSLSAAISAQFTLKMCAAANICKTPPLLKVQGHWRSLMLTPFKSSSLLFVGLSSMYVPIYNCFRERRASSCKITTYQGGIGLWRPPAQASFNLKGQHLNCKNLRLMLKISCAGFLVYPQLFCRNSLLKCALQPKTAKKNWKP